MALVSSQATDVALEFRGADFDWKHTGWTRSAANRSLAAAAAQTLDPAAAPGSTNGRLGRRRRRGRSVSNADSPPESPTEPLLKGLRFSVRRGELLGICGEVRSLYIRDVAALRLLILAVNAVRHQTTSLLYPLSAISCHGQRPLFHVRKLHHCCSNISIVDL